MFIFSRIFKFLFGYSWLANTDFAWALTVLLSGGYGLSLKRLFVGDKKNKFRYVIFMLVNLQHTAFTLVLCRLWLNNSFYDICKQVLDSGAEGYLRFIRTQLWQNRVSRCSDRSLFLQVKQAFLQVLSSADLKQEKLNFPQIFGEKARGHNISCF